MDKQKVNITVRGQSYSILTDEEPERVLALSNDLNQKLDAIMDSGRVSLTQGLILAALDYAEQAKRFGAEAQKYRSEIADYLEDAENAMTERDRLKRENDKLKERLMQ